MKTNLVEINLQGSAPHNLNELVHERKLANMCGSGREWETNTKKTQKGKGFAWPILEAKEVHVNIASDCFATNLISIVYQQRFNQPH